MDIVSASTDSLHATVMSGPGGGENDFQLNFRGRKGN